jgi:hypothetical protein
MRKKLLALLLSAGLFLTGLTTFPTTASASEQTDSELSVGDIHAEAKKFADTGTKHSFKGSTNSTKGDSYWDQFSGHVFYDQLSPDEKALYDKLKAMSDKYLTQNVSAGLRFLNDGNSGYYTDTVTYSNMSSTQAFSVATIFFFENPQYYFYNDGIGYTDPIESYFWGISEPGTVSLGVYSGYADGNVRAGYTQKYKDAIDTYIQGASAYNNDLAKETYFHDTLASTITYNQNTTGYNEDTTESQSASSAFLMKNTVCAGFTKAFSLLLNSQGIENVGLTSDSHAWNEVKINGTWYITDVTWDNNRWPSHDYFNISEYEMQSMDQQWAHSPLTYYYSIRPACTTAHTSTVDAVNLSDPTQLAGYTPSDNNTSTDDQGSSSTSKENKDNPTITPVTPDPQEVTITRPVKPSTFTVKRVKRGTLRLTVKTKSRVSGCYIYYRQKGVTAWDTKYVKVNGRSKTFNITGLSKGKTYQLRAFSVDSKGTLSKGTKVRTVKA